jgi:FKBP-type peptidyl-prolyl cis-trans isomerase
MKRILVALGLFLMTGCQSAPPAGPAPPAPAPSPTAVADKDGYFPTKNGVRYIILREAPGIQATEGKNLKVNYVGTLENGQTFDSTYDRKQTFDFTLGNHQVIQGWEEGMLGMRVGEKRKLIIPPNLAYGASGYPPSIPPNARLTFIVELMEVY